MEKRELRPIPSKIPKPIDQNIRCNICTNVFPKNKIGSYGLCKSCFEFILQDIELTNKQLNETTSILMNTKNLDTFKSRYDFLMKKFNHTETLKKYLDKDPSEFRDKANELLNPRLIALLSTISQASNKKSLSLKTFKAKINNANKTINKLNGLDNYFTDDFHRDIYIQMLQNHKDSLEIFKNNLKRKLSVK